MSFYFHHHCGMCRRFSYISWKDIVKILFLLCFVCLVFNFISFSLSITSMDHPMFKIGIGMLYVQINMFSFHAVYYGNETRIFINIFINLLWFTWIFSFSFSWKYLELYCFFFVFVLFLFVFFFKKTGSGIVLKQINA